MDAPVKYRIADYAGWFCKQRPDVKQPLDMYLADDIEQYIKWLLGFKYSDQIRRELEQFTYKSTPLSKEERSEIIRDELNRG